LGKCRVSNGHWTRVTGHSCGSPLTCENCGRRREIPGLLAAIGFESDGRLGDVVARLDLLGRRGAAVHQEAPRVLELAKTDYYAVHGDQDKLAGLLEGHGQAPDERLLLYKLYHAPWSCGTGSCPPARRPPARHCR
jgi:hypothetical protein